MDKNSKSTFSIKDSQITMKFKNGNCVTFYSEGQPIPKHDDKHSIFLMRNMLFEYKKEDK